MPASKDSKIVIIVNGYLSNESLCFQCDCLFVYVFTKQKKAFANSSGKDHDTAKWVEEILQQTIVGGNAIIPDQDICAISVSAAITLWHVWI